MSILNLINKKFKRNWHIICFYLPRYIRRNILQFYGRRKKETIPSIHYLRQYYFCSFQSSRESNLNVMFTYKLQSILKQVHVRTKKKTVMARGLHGQQLAASPFASWYLRLKCVLNQRGNDCHISISNQVTFAHVLENKRSQYHTVTVACMKYKLERKGLRVQEERLIYKGSPCRGCPRLSQTP